MSYRSEHIYAAGLAKHGPAKYRWSVTFKLTTLSRDDIVHQGWAWSYKGAKRKIAKVVARQRLIEDTVESWTETL